MKTTLYSQFAVLALANREWKRPNQPALQGEGLRTTRVTRRAEHEPELPRGYRHISSAINALMAAEADWESSPSDAGDYRDGVLDRIDEALAELKEGVISRFRTSETAVANLNFYQQEMQGSPAPQQTTRVGRPL